MDIASHLSDLRGRISGCHVAAFIDLSAKMVLAHDARSKLPQERLDGLADRAERLLKTPGLIDGADHVVAVSSDNLEIFIRAETESLAFVCNTSADVDQAVEHGQAWFAQVSAHD